MKNIKMLAVASMISLGALSMVACQKTEPDINIEKDIQGTGIGEYKGDVEQDAKGGNGDIINDKDLTSGGWSKATAENYWQEPYTIKDGRKYNKWGDDVTDLDTEKHTGGGKTVVADKNLSAEQVERISDAFDKITKQEGEATRKRSDEIKAAQVALAKKFVKYLDSEKTLENQLGAQYKEVSGFDKSMYRYGQETYPGSKLIAINPLNILGEGGYECRNGFIVPTEDSWYNREDNKFVDISEVFTEEDIKDLEKAYGTNFTGIYYDIDKEVFKINNPEIKIVPDHYAVIGKEWGCFGENLQPLWIEADKAAFADYSGKEHGMSNKGETANSAYWS